MKSYLKLLFLGIIVLLSNQSIAQDSKEDRKAAKTAKKEAKMKQSLEDSQRLKGYVAAKSFVLEASTLFDDNGNTYQLSPSINFIGFDGENSTIQLSFNQLVGWNGIGGVTIDGRIEKMEIEGDPKIPNFTVNAAVLNKGGGLVTMIFRISSDGNARVDMSGNFGQRLSFQGRIVPLNEKSVYKGTPSF